MTNEASACLPAAAGQFPATQWSVVRAASRKDTRAQHSLATLCQTYWQPLFAFVRRYGHSPEDAQDLTQGFFQHLLEHRTLAVVDRTRGKFRSFLLTALKNFLVNERERAQARKRGGGCGFIPLDAAPTEMRSRLEPADPANPEKLFERNWALALLERVLGRLRAEQEAVNKGAQFKKLQSSLMADPDAPAYARLAAELGMSAEAVRMIVHRLRRRYRQLLREEIAPPGSSPVEVDEELRHLLTVLGG